MRRSELISRIVCAGERPLVLCPRWCVEYFVLDTLSGAFDWNNRNNVRAVADLVMGLALEHGSQREAVEA